MGTYWLSGLTAFRGRPSARWTRASAAHPEPGGAPGRAPRGVHREGRVAGGRGLLEGDRLARRLPGLDLEGDGGRVDRGLDALVVGALDALLDAAAVGVHEGCPGRERAGWGGREARG